MKASISTFGSCLVESIFYYASLNGRNEYLIRNRFFQISPQSLMYNRERISFLENFNPQSLYENAKNSIKSDIEKSVFDKLKKKRTNYIIIDFLACDKTHLRLNAGGKEYILTYLPEVKKNVVELQKLLKENNVDYEVCRATYFDTKFERIICQFMEELLNIYSPEEIILLESNTAEMALTKSKSLLDFGDKKNRNIYRDRALKCASQYVPKTNIVPILDMIIGDSQHYQGLSKEHYHYLYYEYAIQYIDNIVDLNQKTIDLNRFEECTKQLYMEYSLKMYNVLYNATRVLLSHHDELYLRNSYNEVRLESLQNKEGYYVDRVKNFYGIEKTTNPDYYDELITKDDMNSYFDFVLHKLKECMVFFSVRDDASEFWSLFKIKNTMGVKDLLEFRQSYVSVFDVESGRLVEKIGESGGNISYECQMILEREDVFSYKGSENREIYHVRLVSKGFSSSKRKDTKHWSKILINNIEWSMNRRGMNIVLFDKKMRQVVDSCFVDLHGDKKIKIQRK